MTDIVERLWLSPESDAWSDSWSSHARGTEAAAEIERLRAENDRLRHALHVTVTRPAGVVPDVALEFYDCAHEGLGTMARAAIAKAEGEG